MARARRTIAKIESEKKPRAVRLGEAAGIADLFGVSLDSLLGRKPEAQRNELTYLLRALRQSSQQVWASLETIRELLEEPRLTTSCGVRKAGRSCRRRPLMELEVPEDEAQS